MDFYISAIIVLILLALLLILSIYKDKGRNPFR